MRRPFVLLSLLAAGVAGPFAPSAHAYPMCADAEIKVEPLYFWTYVTPQCVDYPYGMQCDETWAWERGVYSVNSEVCYPILTGAPVQPAATSAQTTP